MHLLTHAHLAAANTQQGAGSSTLIFYALLGVAIVGMFVFQSRNRKRAAAAQEQKRAAIAEGVDVRMISGLKGTVAWIEDKEVGIEIAPDVVARFDKTAIAEVLPPTTAAAAMVDADADDTEEYEEYEEYDDEDGVDVATDEVDQEPEAHVGQDADESERRPPNNPISEH